MKEYFLRFLLIKLSLSLNWTNLHKIMYLFYFYNNLLSSFTLLLSFNLRFYPMKSNFYVYK